MRVQCRPLPNLAGSVDKAAFRVVSGAVGLPANLALVSGILQEAIRVHGLVFGIGGLPRRGFGKELNPAGTMAALRASLCYSSVAL